MSLERPRFRSPVQSYPEDNTPIDNSNSTELTNVFIGFTAVNGLVSAVMLSGGNENGLVPLALAGISGVLAWAASRLRD